MSQNGFDLLRSSVRKMWFKIHHQMPQKQIYPFDDSFTQNTEKFYEIVKMLKNRYEAENSKEIRAEAEKLLTVCKQNVCACLINGA